MINLDPTWGTGAILDVETTGFSPVNDEIIELSVLLFSFSRETYQIKGIVDRYTGLREPSRPIPWGAARVHGITNKTVIGKSLDHMRIESIIGKAEFIIAHNATFDRGFVVPMFKVSAAKPWLCSMRGIDWKGRGFRSKSLQSLLADHGITVRRAHRAEDDVKATLRLLSHSDKRGYTYLSELLLFSKEYRAAVSEISSLYRDSATAKDGQGGNPF